MPAYDFVCDKCGHKFELIEKITEAPKAEDVECPKCGGTVQQTWEDGNLNWSFRQRFR